MNVWINFTPDLSNAVDQRRFLETAKKLVRASEAQPDLLLFAVEEVKREAYSLRRAKTAKAVEASVLTLSDLVAQGWKCRIRRQVVQVKKPPHNNGEREIIRRQLHVERNRQLETPSVQEFLKSMERRRFHQGRWVSIFSLMRDGRDLAERLRVAHNNSTSSYPIKPYLQTVKEDELCGRTGLPLRDIWRYFRHTWANPYRSVPGRSLLILVRDAAVEPHPVIGIAALASSAVQIGVRDEWIGWSADSYVQSLRENGTDSHAVWLQALVNTGIEGIYQDDFLDASLDLLNRRLVAHPTPQVLKKLEEYAKIQREEHRRLADAGEFKNAISSMEDEDWREHAETPLFCSKRAETLAMLLRVRMFLNEANRNFDGVELRKMLSVPEPRQAIQSLVRRAKSERVGIAMADISVCGAVAPYSAILGGKLVAMLMASPEIVTAYSERYSSSPSVIASSLAGRVVIRPPHLVLLCTASLYGTEPTQYTRITVPAERVGGEAGDRVSYRLLGRTEGYGTFQFSPETVEAISVFLSQSAGGLRIHSIFGEGVSPRLRKIREGLDRLNLPADELLSHGSQRLVYGVALARNFREYLMGLDEEPDYLLPLSDPAHSTELIGEWWVERWLRSRVCRDEVLAEVARHRLTHPVRHGARVPVPGAIGGQIALFSDITGGD
jgi:Domain of unknown function (DUF4338)